MCSMFHTLLFPSSAEIRTQLFGVTNAQTLFHSFNEMTTTFCRWNNSISVNRKNACTGLNCGGFLCSASPSSSSGDSSGSSSLGDPTTFGSLDEFPSLRSSRSLEKDRDESEAPVLSTFDFLELKRELEKEENSREVSEDEERRQQNADDAPSGIGKEGIVAGSSRVRGGRQVMRWSNLLAKQVISLESARNLGFVSQLWVDTKLWVVALVEVRPNFLSGDTDKFLLDDVYQVGDVVLISNEPLMDNELKMTGLDALVGYDVVKPGRRSIGKIRGYTFNINTGAVEALEFDSFGFSIIPSSLVSTYRLSVEDVLYVESDKVFLREEALSHVQRLTKGIWDPGNIGKSKERLENRDFRRKRAYSDLRNSNRRSRRPKFPDDDVRDDDDWDFPINY